MIDFLDVLLGGFVGAALGFVATLLTLRYNYHQLYAQTVSSNRMDWINVWRKSIAELLVCAKVLHKSQGKKNPDTLTLKEYETAKEAVILRLNLKEETHCLMLAAINNLNYEQSTAQFQNECLYIEELTRDILKPEWERVKAEANGKRR